MEEISHSEVLTLISIARLGDEAYGVTIRRDILEESGRDVSLAAVYAALDRLEALGLTRPWLSTPRPERGGRARRHYALTPAGRTQLRRERAQSLRMWRGVPSPTRSRK